MLRFPPQARSRGFNANPGDRETLQIFSRMVEGGDVRPPSVGRVMDEFSDDKVAVSPMNGWECVTPPTWPPASRDLRWKSCVNC